MASDTDIAALIRALREVSLELSDALRRFDKSVSSEDLGWDEVAYRDLWEAVKDVGRLTRSAQVTLKDDDQ